MPGYGFTATDPRRPTAATGTVRSQSLGKVFAGLTGHGLDAGCVWGLLRFAQERGDAETAAARVSYDGSHWVADMFGKAQGAL